MLIKLLAVCVLVASAGAVVFAEPGPDAPAAGRGLFTHSATLTVDSVGTSQTALTNTYDATGNLLVSVRTFDWENDGIPNSSTTVTSSYNAGGTVASTITATDFDANGVVDSYLTETYSYDDRGNVLVFEAKSDGDADGVIDARSGFTATYNAASQPLDQRFEDDFDNNGEPETVGIRTYTYHPNGQLALFNLKIYYDGVLGGSDLTSYNYDARGRVVKTETSTDFDGTGTFLQHSTVTFTYNVRGDIESTVMLHRPDADSDPYYRESIINEYDGQWRLLKETIEQDYGADGVDVGGTITTYTYDARGHVVTSVRESFGSELIERQALFYTYDAIGNLIETVSEFSFADLFSTETTRYEY